MVDFAKKLDEALDEAKRNKKATIHFTTETLESDRPTAICGIRTTAASSTENHEAVTCGRCLKKLSKNPDTGDSKKMEDTVVQASPIQLMSEGVEIDTATSLDEALTKARDISDSLGGVEVEIVQDSAIIDRVGQPEEDEPEEEEEPEEEVEEETSKPAKKAKVTNIKDGQEKAAAKKTEAKPTKNAVPPKAKGKVKKEQSECVCGCGIPTGGTFAPGHDGRVHSWMKQIAAGKAKYKDFPEIAQKYMKAHTA